MVYYQGERLTDELAQRIAEETLADLRRRNLIPGHAHVVSRFWGDVALKKGLVPVPGQAWLRI